MMSPKITINTTDNTRMQTKGLKKIKQKKKPTPKTQQTKTSINRNTVVTMTLQTEKQNIHRR